jgi:ABC-type uncharacterized transport system auxiliary subunit
MKAFTTAILAAFAALAASTLLAGCASDAQNATAYADPSYTPVGTYIPRKKASIADNVTQVDKQALENDRIMGGGTINSPGK